jgi:hypothetical protein
MYVGKLRYLALGFFLLLDGVAITFIIRVGDLLEQSSETLNYKQAFIN